MKVFLSITFLFLFSYIEAQSTYYVSLMGDNNNNGLTEASAWRTFSYAASSESPVGAGDTVYIKAGDYGAEEVFVDKNYAPEDARISFIGYQNTPGDITEFNFTYGDEVNASMMPLYNPGNRLVGEGINLSDVYAITIKNIQVTNSLVGISIWNSSSINSSHILENIFLKDIGWEYSTAIGIKEGGGNIVKHCLVVNATGAGMDIWGDNNLIDSCQVYSNESEMTIDSSYTSMDYYIVIKGNNSVVSNCYAERDGDLEDVGHGLEIKESGENNLFINCTVKNMISGCFSVRWSGVQNNEFRNCVALGGVSDDVCALMVREGASNNVFNACTSQDCEAGIRYLLSGEDADYCGSNNVFNNCIFRNATWAIDLNPYAYNSAPVDNNLMVNCVIDQATNLINSERPNSGNQLINCIVRGVDNFVIGDHPSSFEFTYCDFYNDIFTTPIGAGNIDGDPLFANALSGDYHLLTGSPCIDSGTASNAPDLDFEGNLRPQGAGYDMGAFEYGGIDGIEEITNEFTVSPNPTDGKVYVPSQFIGHIVQLFSATGLLVKSGVLLGSELDLSGLVPGVYLLRLESPSSENKIFTCQIKIEF